MLAAYIADTQNLLNDVGSQFFNESTLTNYINRSRRRVAWASGCVRVLIRATTVPDQQEYKFHEWTAIAQATPGVREIYAIRSLGIAIGPGDGAWKPLWSRIPFTDWQARFGIWNRAWRGTISYPGFYAQFGFGTAGSIFLAPIPSQDQPMEMDTSCTPFPLQTDNDPEAIPQPWSDVVPYYAAFLGLLQQQRKEDAAAMMQIMTADLPFAASVVNVQSIVAPYGAAMRSA